jgi:hypothetical protein
MRFYTKEECEQWLAGRERELPDTADSSTRQFPYPARLGGLCFAAQWIAAEQTYRSPALLWITDWGTWPSSENWHLYYKLRQSYGDQRLLEEAPGHLFLGYETEDLASFLQLAMLNGWDGYLFTEANYVNLRFGHEEYLYFYADEEAHLTGIGEAFSGEPVEAESTVALEE